MPAQPDKKSYSGPQHLQQKKTLTVYHKHNSTVQISYSAGVLAARKHVQQQQQSHVMWLVLSLATALSRRTDSCRRSRISSLMANRSTCSN
jgi:hypothetical protein